MNTSDARPQSPSEIEAAAVAASAAEEAARKSAEGALLALRAKTAYGVPRLFVSIFCFVGIGAAVVGALGCAIATSNGAKSSLLALQLISLVPILIVARWSVHALFDLADLAREQAGK